MNQVYPWLIPTWQKWQSLSQAGRVSAAMLCTAAPGMGVGQLVERFVRTLVCSNSDTEPCGLCHSCELNESGNHPDIHWVKPESEGKNITVDQIRECNRRVMESSQLGGRRVIIIQPAEAMNESASNALLKTLEAPPENCIFLLLSHNRVKLLPTIISRCQLWDIAEPDIETTYEWLKAKSHAAVTYNDIRLNKGAPLKTLEFYDGGEHERFIEMENLFCSELQKAFPDTTALNKCLKDNSTTALLWLAVILADVQKVHFHINEKGMCAKSSELAQIIPYSVAYDALNKLNNLREQLTTFTGLNQELLFTNWILELHEEICL